LSIGLKSTGFTLVLGGVRSGKSSFARTLCEAADGSAVFIATATPLDVEMEKRIVRHRQERGERWSTLEEPLEVAGCLTSIKSGSVVLVDCLTLWLTNLMELGLDDEVILSRVQDLAAAMRDCAAAVVAVSNDVGGGITPVNALARRFADLSGLMNQSMAACAEDVYFITAGLPARLK